MVKLTRATIIERLEAHGFKTRFHETGSVTFSRDTWEHTYDWASLESHEVVVDDYMEFSWTFDQ